MKSASDRRAGKRFFGLRVGDLVAVCLVIAAAVFSMVILSGSKSTARGGMAVIEVNGKAVKRIVLGEGQEGGSYTVKGRNGDSVIEVEGGKVHMVESACRDKICVGMGWTDSSGQSIVCVPNRVVIRITGSGSDVDAVTQ